MSSNVVQRNDLLASVTVDLRLSRFAFFHKIFIRVSHGMAGVKYQKYNVIVALRSDRWEGLHLILNPRWLVRTK